MIPHTPPAAPESLSPLERKTRAITPPLEEIETPSLAHDQHVMIFDDISEQPISYAYLLHLFTAPDMRAYLAHTHFTDDVYALPIHLQRLISEAKEEVVIARSSAAQAHDARPPEEECHATQRLQRLKEYLWARSGHDVSNMLGSIAEVIQDEDELEHLIQQ